MPTVEHGRPFWAVVVFELCALGAIVTSTYPYVVPPYLTLDQAAAPQSSLLFLVVGAGACIPIVLAYNVYAYWTFRGTFTPVEADGPVTAAPLAAALQRDAQRAAARDTAVQDHAARRNGAATQTHPDGEQGQRTVLRAVEQDVERAAPAVGHGFVHWMVNLVWIAGSVVAAFVALNVLGRTSAVPSLVGLAVIWVVIAVAWIRRPPHPADPTAAPPDSPGAH